MDYSQQSPPDQPPGGSPAPAQPPVPGQQPQYPPPGGYQAPPPPAPQQRKGFNWLACCGITCAILLIIGGGIGYCTYRVLQPVISMVMTMDRVAGAVNAADLQTITGEALEIDTQLLVSDPTIYEEQWTALTGEIAQLGLPPGMSFSASNFSTEQTTNYVLDHNVMLIDLSRAPAVGVAGDRVLAYGQCYAWSLRELESMPLFGGLIAEGIKQDPSLAGNTEMILFFAKSVERIGDGDGAQPAVDEAAGEAAGGADGDSGWGR